MTKLFSYRIPHDTGAAPNPFWGICTLVICKPRIRLKAEIGDWIIGLGSANSPLGDISNSSVFIMCVTAKMSLEDYDNFVKLNYPNKLPDWNHKDVRRRVGDAIYSYANPSKVQLRRGVHGEKDKERDLSGKYALLSEYFFYFGNQPLALPSELLPITQVVRGHRSHANDPYIADFLNWLNNLNLKRNHLYGEPIHSLGSTKDKVGPMPPQKLISLDNIQ